MVDFSNQGDGVNYTGQAPVAGFAVAARGVRTSAQVNEWAFRDGRKLVRTNAGDSPEKSAFVIRSASGAETRFDTDKVITANVAGGNGHMFVAKDGASILINDRGLAFYRKNSTDIMEPLNPAIAGQGAINDRSNAASPAQDSKKVSAYSIQGKNGEHYIVGLNANLTNPDGSSPKVSVYKQNPNTGIYGRQDIADVSKVGQDAQKIKLSDGTVIGGSTNNPSLNGVQAESGPEVSNRALGPIMADAERMPSRTVPEWGRSRSVGAPSP